jgi:TRAP-type C4-dicarboxylate transport system permease small subunit
MARLQRIIDLLAAALMIVGGVALTLMMGHVTVDVIGKYFFNRPVPITLEMVSNYYMVAVVFLPLAAVERRNGHIHVELIYAHLARVVRRLLDVLAYGLGIFFFSMLTWTAWDVAVRKFLVGEFIMGSYSVIIWPSRFLVPAGGALITVLLLLKLVRSAVALVRADLDPDADQTDAQHDGVH